MAQFGRPDADVTNTGTNGFAAIDESVASDADFWWGDNNVAEELEVSLSNVSDPLLSTGHTFRYRIAKTNAGTVDGGGNAVTVTARLMQSTTQIATDTAKTADGTWTQYSFTLSEAQANSITDYNDLRLEFVTSASGGAPSARRGGAVSWAELEVPNVAITGSAALPLTLSIATAGVNFGNPILNAFVTPEQIPDDKQPVALDSRIISPPEPVGPATHFGAASLGLTLTVATAGFKTTTSSAALPLTLTVFSAGARELTGSAALGLTLSVATAGFKTTAGAVALPLTVGIATAGFKFTTSSAALPLSFNVVTAGFKTTTSSVALPLSLNITTAGFKTTTSSVVLPLVLTIGTNGTVGGGVGVALHRTLLGVGV
jgi:hypothetical protein